MGIKNSLRKSPRFKKFLFNLFSLLPIQKNKIVFCNFSGKRCGDNPRAISDFLQRKRPSLDIVWLAHPKYNPEVPAGTRMVPFGEGSFKMIYELATAKVWVDSHTKFAFTQKRKGQFYMETWHGGLGFKKVEGDAADVLDQEYLDRVKVNSALADVFISNSRWMSDLVRRAFWFKNTILEKGLPRNDMLLKKDEEILHQVREYFHIDEQTRIALYAPTFRSQDKTDCYDIDAKAVVKKLEEKTQEKWVLLIRLHPMAMKLDVSFPYGENVINATQHPDMQALLMSTDLLITDYSSSIFDYALTRKPGLIFALDIEEYNKDRGFYFQFEELPFPLARSNQELLNNIENFNNDEYLSHWDAFAKRVGLSETGFATEAAVQQIEQWLDL